MKRMMIFLTGLTIAMVFIFNNALAENPEWKHYAHYANRTDKVDIRAIVPTNGDSAWLGTHHSGLINLDKKTGAITFYNTENSDLLDDRIWALATDLSGSLWIGTSEGLVNFDGTNWTVVNSPLFPTDWENNSIASLDVDSFGNLWVGTRKSGLFRYDGANWIVYNKDNSPLPGNYIFTPPVYDLSGNLWIGTGYGGLARIDSNNNWTVYTKDNSPLPDNSITGLAVNSVGGLWICTWLGGVVYFDGVNWTLYNENNSPLPVEMTRRLVIDLTGTVWIGSDNGGIFGFDGSNWTVYNKDNSPLVSNNIYFLAVDSYNNLWISHSIEGVFVYQKSGIITGIQENTSAFPESFILHQNFPNPFNPSTKIEFDLPEPSLVTLEIFNILGQQVTTLVNRESLASGTHQVIWDARGFSSGVYLYRLTTKSFTETKRMVVVR